MVTYDLLLKKTDSMRWFYHRHRFGGRYRLTNAQHPLGGSHEMGPSAAAARCLQRAHTIRTHPGVSAALSAFFPFVVDIRTRARFLYSAPAKFHHPTLNRSEVIVRTNRQTDSVCLFVCLSVCLTNWQTNRRRWKHWPRYATPVG